MVRVGKWALFQNLEVKTLKYDDIIILKLLFKSVKSLILFFFFTIKCPRLCVSILVYFLQWAWMLWWRWLTQVQLIVWTSEILKLLRSWGKKHFLTRLTWSLWNELPKELKTLFVSRGTIDDCELVEGLVLTQKVANTGVTRVEKAKIGLIQFCLSAPKTDVS